MQQRTSTPLTHVIKGILALAFVGAGAFSGPPAQAGIDVQINIGNAPPPPRFVFESRPHERYYRSEGVYVVDDPGVGDNDCFRYGNYYWVFYDGYWYRSYNWRGPFAVVYPRSVPAVFYRMPPSRWKHRPNGPPRYAQSDGRRGDYLPPASPPRRMPTGGGNPPGHITQDNPPRHMQPAAPHGRRQQDNMPPGQRKKEDKDRGNGNGKGNGDGGGHGH